MTSDLTSVQVAPQAGWFLADNVQISGIMNVNRTGKRIDTSHAGSHTAFGHLVAPNVNAPNHQHFFSYRLDLDVDGASNTVFGVDARSATANDW